jgi:hypothetical protein
MPRKGWQPSDETRAKWRAAHERRRSPEAFWARVQKMPNGCWEWPYRNPAHGYGELMVNTKHVRAHRRAYELAVGPIPEGLQLDHLCRNRACVNPDHLEAVTAQVNVRRAQGTHCKAGHPFAGDNLRLTPKGRRVCKTCMRGYQLRRPERRKAA